MRDMPGMRQADKPFGDDNWDVSPDVQVSVCISCGYLDTGTFQALLEWLAKDGVVVLGGNCGPWQQSGNEGAEEGERTTFVRLGIFFCSLCGRELRPPLEQ